MQESLFTHIPLPEAIGLCDKNFYRNHKLIDSLLKSYFCRLLKMKMYESFFIFNQTYYNQFDGVTTGTTLGLALPNASMCHFENILLEICPTNFKSVMCGRYFNDTFSLFCSTEHVERFKKYLNTQHKNISFTSEFEQNG